MTARELIELLQMEHPAQEVVLYTEGHRILQFIGINRQASSKFGAVVIDVDWSETEGRVVETEEDKLKRQRDKLDKEIQKLTDEKKKELARVVRKQSKSKRTQAAQIIDSLLEPQKKGKTKGATKRPPGRPRKYKKKEEM